MNEGRMRERATGGFVSHEIVTHEIVAHDARSIEEQPINALSMLR